MPVSIQCDSCKRRLKVPDQFIGKKIRCPACKTVMLARPIEERPPIAELADDDDDAGSPPVKKLKRAKSTTTGDEKPAKSSAGKAALKDYQKGMRNLGNSLIALAIFYFIIAVLAMAGSVVLFVILGVVAGLQLGFGILARQQHHWVNYVIGVLALLSLALNILAIVSSLLVAAPAPGLSGSRIPFGFGILVASWFLHRCTGNIRLLGRARAAGLEP